MTESDRRPWKGILAIAALGIYSIVSIAHERRVSKPCLATEISKRERLKLYPDHAIAGSRFNVQPDGSSAIGIVGRCLPMSGVVYWNGQELDTIWTPAEMSASVPNVLLETPGPVTIRVHDTRGYGGEASFIVLPQRSDRP